MCLPCQMHLNHSLVSSLKSSCMTQRFRRSWHVLAPKRPTISTTTTNDTYKYLHPSNTKNSSRSSQSNNNWKRKSSSTKDIERKESPLLLKPVNTRMNLPEGYGDHPLPSLTLIGTRKDQIQNLDQEVIKDA